MKDDDFNIDYIIQETDSDYNNVVAEVSRGPIFISLLIFSVLFFVILSKVYFIQIVDGDTYKELSSNNLLQRDVIFSKRGTIFDRNGEVLAYSDQVEDGSYNRKYIDINGLGHVLGYVNTPEKDIFGNYYSYQNEGQIGAEQLFDSVLEGRSGYHFIEKDALGDSQSLHTLDKPINGKDVEISIDSKLNNIVYETISKIIEERGFLGGAAIISDVNNGEILSMVSYPDIDPKVLTEKEDVDLIRDYQSGGSSVFLNRAISGLFTPGSTVKPFFAIAALEEGLVEPSTTFISTGSISVPNPYIPGEFSVFNDWKAHGAVDLQRAIAVSSNVYFYHIGGGFENQIGLGIERINSYAERFGLLKPTEIYLSVEPQGIIPNPDWKRTNFNDIWRLGDTYNTVIGQYGFQLTPLQLLRGISTIANGGTLVEPHIEKGRGTKKVKLDISKESLAQARFGMRKTVTEGTATRLDVPFVKVAAKTGTAETNVKKDKINSLLTGYFPYESPQYAFVIVFEKGPVLTGNSSMAGFAMEEILNKINEELPSYFNTI